MDDWCLTCIRSLTKDTKMNDATAKRSDELFAHLE